METESENDQDDFEVDRNLTGETVSETKMTMRIFSNSETEKLENSIKDLFDLSILEELMGNDELFEVWQEAKQETCPNKGTFIVTSESTRIAEMLQKLARDQQIYCTVTKPEKKEIMQTFIPTDLRTKANLEQLKKHLCFASKISPENFEFLGESRQEDKKSKRKGSYITIRVNEAGIKQLTEAGWRLRSLLNPSKFFTVKYRDPKLEWARKNEVKSKQEAANAERKTKVLLEREETRKRKRDETDPKNWISDEVMAKSKKRNLSPDDATLMYSSISTLNAEYKLAERSEMKNFETKARRAAQTYSESTYWRKEDTLHDVAIGATYVLTQLILPNLRLPIRGYGTLLGLSGDEPAGVRVARKMLSGITNYYSEDTTDDLLEKAKKIKSQLDDVKW